MVSLPTKCFTLKVNNFNPNFRVAYEKGVHFKAGSKRKTQKSQKIQYITSTELKVIAQCCQLPNSVLLFIYF